MNVFSPIKGQNIEFFGGAALNHLFNVGNGGHFDIDYSENNGYTFGIGIEQIKLDSTHIRFTLRYDELSGEFHEKKYGQASGSSTRAQFEKSLLTLGIYPFSIRILKKIDLNFGIEISRLLKEEFSGTGWSINYMASDSITQYTYDLQDKIERLSFLWNFGLQAQIAYNIGLSESLILTPQYSFYFGFSDQFSEKARGTKLIRNYICIAIKMKLNK